MKRHLSIFVLLFLVSINASFAQPKRVKDMLNYLPKNRDSIKELGIHSILIKSGPVYKTPVPYGVYPVSSAGRKLKEKGGDYCLKEYDKNGNEIKYTQFGYPEITINYVYDLFNQVIIKTSSGGGRQEVIKYKNEYHENGILKMQFTIKPAYYSIKLNDSIRNKTFKHYNKAGLITGVIYSKGDSLTSRRTLKYDYKNRIIEDIWFDKDLVKKSSETFRYDKFGNMTEKITTQYIYGKPYKSRMIAKKYNSTNQLIEEITAKDTSANAARHITNYTYDERGNLIRKHDNRGTLYAGKYNLQNQLTEARGQSSIRTYGYDDNGNTIKEAEYRSSTRPSVFWESVFNEFNQLTEVKITNNKPYEISDLRYIIEYTYWADVKESEEATKLKLTDSISYWPNGQIRAKGKLWYGRLQGECLGFWPNGHFAFKDVYEKGELQSSQGSSITTEKNNKNGDEYTIITIWRDNGRKHTEKNLKNGKLHGSSLEWNELGNKVNQEFYHEGEPDSVWTSWGWYGKVKSNKSYKLGKKEGLFTWWSSGKKTKEGKYLNDLEEGEWKTWKDGQLIGQFFYVEGVRDGTWTHWLPNGTLEGEYTYSKGLVVKGREINYKYYGSHVTMILGNTVEDEKQGLWTEYSQKKGRELSEGSYNRGRKTGKWLEWTFSGDRTESHYENDKKNGRWILTNKYEQTIREGYYSNDEKDGLWTNWYLKGQKMSEVNFSNGEPSGDYSFWTVKGELTARGKTEPPEWDWIVKLNKATRVNDMAFDDDGNCYLTGGLKTAKGLKKGVRRESFFLAQYNKKGQEVWKTNSIGTASVMGMGIGVDDQGNCYVTGMFKDTFELEGIQLIGNANNSVFIAKFDKKGKAIWAKQAGPKYKPRSRSTYSKPEAMSVDQAGNSYVTGFFMDTVYFENQKLFSGGTSSTGRQDVFLAKYNTNGNLLWVKHGRGLQREEGKGIGLDADGNCYITGDTWGTPLYFDDHAIKPTMGNDLFMAKFDADGNYIWGHAAGTTKRTSVGSHTDPSGNTTITGRILGRRSNIFVTNYNTQGSLIWEAQAHVKGVQSITTDLDGNALVSGSFFKNAKWKSGKGTYAFSLENEIGDAAFIVKYGKDGQLLWVKKATGVGSAMIVGFNKEGTGYLSGSFLDSMTMGNITLKGEKYCVFLGKLKVK